MISVCFITKNEEKWLRGCVEHLRPIVSEFIVVDTGSSDRTVEIARSCGAHVSCVAWPGDFAAARNLSLSKATQPWIMKIDPDERLDPRDFAAFVKLTEGSAPAYQCWTRAYTNDPSRVMTPTYHKTEGEYSELEKGWKGFVMYPSIRLFKNIPGLKYVGKIHETVEPNLPGWVDGRSPVAAATTIYFHHYGHSQEAFSEKGKSAFYMKLLLEELERNPSNWYVLYEFANAKFVAGDYPAAIRAYERADQSLPLKPQILSNWGYSLVLSGHVSAGEQKLKECLMVDDHYLDAWLNLGVARMQMKDFRGALLYFDHCLQLDPRSVVALRAKGQALAQLGQHDMAIRSFTDALHLVPHFKEAKVDLAILYSKDASKKTETLALISEVLAEYPDDLRAQTLAQSLTPTQT